MEKVAPEPPVQALPKKSDVMKVLRMLAEAGALAATAEATRIGVATLLAA